MDALARFTGRIQLDQPCQCPDTSTQGDPDLWCATHNSYWPAGHAVCDVVAVLNDHAALASQVTSPWVQRALANQLPAKELSREPAL